MDSVGLLLERVAKQQPELQWLDHVRVNTRNALNRLRLFAIRFLHLRNALGPEGVRLTDATDCSITAANHNTCALNQGKRLTAKLYS
jgi:hypothetical protein